MTIRSHFDHLLHLRHFFLNRHLLVRLVILHRLPLLQVLLALRRQIHIHVSILPSSAHRSPTSIGMLRARRQSSASRTLRNTTNPNPFDWRVALSVQRLNSSRSPYVTRPPHADEATELPLHVVASHVIRRSTEEETALLQRLTTVSRFSRVAAAAVVTRLVATALAIVVTTVVAIVVMAASARLTMIMRVAAVVGIVVTMRIFVIALRVALSTTRKWIFYMGMERKIHTILATQQGNRDSMSRKGDVGIERPRGGFRIIHFHISITLAFPVGMIHNDSHITDRSELIHQVLQISSRNKGRQLAHTQFPQ